MAGLNHRIRETKRTRSVQFDCEDKFSRELSDGLTLPLELYERLSLAYQRKGSEAVRLNFGNATPIGVLGFSVSVVPLAISFMGWRGSGGLSIATTTINIWFGGMLLVIAGIGEFLHGNNFTMMVFLAYGAHFLSYATTFIPFYNSIGFFNPDGSGLGSPGVENQTAIFMASYAFYLAVMCLLSFIFLLGSFRTNGVFAIILLFVTIGFGLGAGTYFQLAQGNTLLGIKLATGLGACFFAAGMLGFYFLAALVITIMELPVPDLPLFDLSIVVRPRPRHSANKD
ncbi:plasma membrane ammonium transporter [Phaeosphaeriaceae sp. PMI808]|nr:plasma membrane ammonium transporter [Phaeosphaeriaceae sp. PMI808]